MWPLPKPDLPWTCVILLYSFRVAYDCLADKLPAPPDEFLFPTRPAMADRLLIPDCLSEAENPRAPPWPTSPILLTTGRRAAENRDLLPTRIPKERYYVLIDARALRQIGGFSRIQGQFQHQYDHQTAAKEGDTYRTTVRLQWCESLSCL